jgi:hypothetical protein
LQELYAVLRRRYQLTCEPYLIEVNCDFGCGAKFGNTAVLASEVAWENVISNYDHIYIQVMSGRNPDKRQTPGAANTGYRLFLSKGPWPLVALDEEPQSNQEQHSPAQSVAETVQSAELRYRLFGRRSR